MKREFVTFKGGSGIIPGTYYRNEGDDRFHPIEETPEAEVAMQFNMLRDNPTSCRTIKKLMLQGLRDMRSLYNRTVAIHFGRLTREYDIDETHLNFESF